MKETGTTSLEDSESSLELNPAVFPVNGRTAPS